ncbi:MAG: hypothetical protein ACYDCI_00450 [Candidatus Limnocylindrales bacterium]
MARKRTPPPLIAAPYVAPPYELGSSLVCELRGRVTVRGISDAPIAWPWTHASRTGDDRPSSRQSLIVCAELARAVRVESNQAVAHWWGVNRKTVYSWRRALGVGRMNPGTIARWSQLAGVRLRGDARKRGAAASRAAKKKSENNC